MAPFSDVDKKIPKIKGKDLVKNGGSKIEENKGELIQKSHRGDES